MTGGLLIGQFGGDLHDSNVISAWSVHVHARGGALVLAVHKDSTH